MTLSILIVPVATELPEKFNSIIWMSKGKDTMAVGNITGAKVNAEQLKNEVSEQIKCIQNKIGQIHNNKRPAVFRVMGLEPIGTIGSRSFQTDVFYHAGGKNIFADIRKDFFQINIDAINEHNPDVVIVCGEDSEKVKQKLKDQKKWKTLEAVKKDRIFVISCDLVCRPGPRIAETIEKIASYLYPDKFVVYPERIISLGPSITEELYLLGVQDKLIGCTMYCKKPEEAKAKEKVATVIEVNLEKVISLKPDIVLATSLTDIKSVQKLKDLEIKVVDFPLPESFSQINDQFLKLGKITGKQKEAAEIINIAKNKVDLIRNKVKDLQRPEVFFQVGAKPLFTITGDSFINDFIEYAGGINIAENLKSGFFSREEVLKADPDILIIVTMGIKGEKEKKIWGKYTTLKAVKNDNIFIIDSYKLCSPTPQSFVEALEEIANILHPEDIGE